MSAPLSPGASVNRSARRILIAAALIQVLLFVSASRGQLALLFSPHAAARPQVIGATIGGIDCHGYYAWLRSPLIDGDWDFTNEYQFYRAHWPGLDEIPNNKLTGRAPNQWSVGPAIVWSVSVVPVHLVTTATGALAEEPRGYSPPYQLAVGSVSLALSLLTLLFAYRIASAFAPPIAASAAAAIVVLGTAIGPYGTVAGGMAHGPATAALAGYIWAWVSTFGSTRYRRWFTVGLLLGMTCLMRWQLATFAVLPALEAAWLVCANWRRPVRPLVLGVCAAGGVVVGFVPQMVAWWAIYGHPLVNPHPTAAEWLSPAFWQVLFSHDRSLFYWTPVALFGTLGLLAASRPGRGDVRSRVLLVAGAIQIYLIAALIDRGVCLGWSFGFRFLTETTVVLVVGFAVLFRSVAARPSAIAIVCGAAVAWNLLLLGVHFHCIPGAESGPAGLMNAVARYIIRRPLEAVLWCTAAMGLAVRLRTGFRSCLPDAETLALPAKPPPAIDRARAA